MTLNVSMFLRKTLTVDGHSDLLLLGVFPAGDAAGVEASVGALQLRDGQDVVEQHVRSVL